MSTLPSTLRIRALNDAFRRSLSGGGTRLMTAGIAALPAPDQAAILAKVMRHDDFTEDNDPHGEHDFGSFEHGRRTVFWKIDYYDLLLCNGSRDPSDPCLTRRVLTVLFAEEY